MLPGSSSSDRNFGWATDRPKAGDVRYLRHNAARAVPMKVDVRVARCALRIGRANDGCRRTAVLAVARGAACNFVRFLARMMRRLIVALDASLVERRAMCRSARAAANERHQIDRTLAQRTKIEVARAAIVIPSGMDSGEAAGRSVMPARPLIDHQPCHIGCRRAGNCQRYQPLDAGQRVAAVQIVERHAQRSLLGGFGDGRVLRHAVFLSKAQGQDDMSHQQHDERNRERQGAATASCAARNGPAAAN